MKEMEHRSEAFFSGLSVYASRISIADRGAAEAGAQQQQHSSSGGGDVAAAASSPLEIWAVVLCLRCGACALCILALGHSPAAAWLFTAAAYLLRCCCCDDHGRRGEEDPSPTYWNNLPSEQSVPSHCLLERSTRSAECWVANSITDNTMIDQTLQFEFPSRMFYVMFLASRKKCVNGSSTKIQGAQKPCLPKMEETRFKLVHLSFCGILFKCATYEC